MESEKVRTRRYPLMILLPLRRWARQPNSSLEWAGDATGPYRRASPWHCLAFRRGGTPVGQLEAAMNVELSLAVPLDPRAG